MMSGASHGARTAAADTLDAPSADERWMRWLARGAARDQRLRERMRYVTGLVGAGLLGWLVFALAAR
jgi:hypothetical protein